MDHEPPSGAYIDEEDEELNEPGTVSLRVVVALLVLLVLAAAGIFIHSCSQSTASASVFSDQISHYAPGSVTYLANARSYLVRANDGSFLALSEVEAAEADRVAGCLIRYRPVSSANAQAGVFRDDCHGTLFNSQGIAVSGDAPPMQRHPTVVSAKMVSVQLRVCLQGGADGRPEACRE